MRPFPSTDQSNLGQSPSGYWCKKVKNNRFVSSPSLGGIPGSYIVLIIFVPSRRFGGYTPESDLPPCAAISIFKADLFSGFFAVFPFCIFFFLWKFSGRFPFVISEIIHSPISGSSPRRLFHPFSLAPIVGKRVKTVHMEGIILISLRREVVPKVITPYYPRRKGASAAVYVNGAFSASPR